MFKTMFARAQKNAANRRRYRQLLNEVNSMSSRDLADIGASRWSLLEAIEADRN